MLKAVRTGSTGHAAGYGVAGTVLSVGAAVTRFKPGDEVPKTLETAAPDDMTESCSPQRAHGGRWWRSWPRTPATVDMALWLWPGKLRALESHSLSCLHVSPHTYSTICCYFDGLTQGSTVARPRELAADVCASSVLGGVAAYTALHYQHRLAAGETVLVLDGWGLARGCV